MSNPIFTIFPIFYPVFYMEKRWLADEKATGKGKWEKARNLSVKKAERGRLSLVCGSARLRSGTESKSFP